VEQQSHRPERVAGTGELIVMSLGVDEAAIEK
jgi:hypothetical protein